MGDAEVYRHKSWVATVKVWQRRRPTECEAPKCQRLDGRAILPGHPLWGMDVGHIVSVRDALRAGWSIEEINAVTNSRPEHARCNRHAGAKVGGRVRSRRLSAPITSRAW